MIFIALLLKENFASWPFILPRLGWEIGLGLGMGYGLGGGGQLYIDTQGSLDRYRLALKERRGEDLRRG